MRDIKFRAWDVIPYYDSEDKKYEMIYFDLEETRIIENLSLESVVMQYTGLQDVNGVEIYEGDIVKSYEGSLYQIIWKDNGFKFLYEFNIRGYDENTIMDLGDTSDKRWGVEVIGNIYDNPELLELEGE